MKSPRRLAIWVFALALAVVGASALVLHERCHVGSKRPPSLIIAAAKEGDLWAGAARVEIHPPYPVVVGGYGPPRPTAKSAARPLSARALVLRIAELKVGLVALDLLLVPESLANEVLSAAKRLNLAQLWVTATHTHSSLGGYDSDLLVQLAGTGLYRRESRSAVLDAASAALFMADSSLAPVELKIGEQAFPGLVYGRSEGPEPDGRLTRIVFARGDVSVAQWLVFGAHPTLVQRPAVALDPDFPGALSQQEEVLGHGVTLFAQGAVGNVSAAAPPDDALRPEHFSSRIAQALEQIPLRRLERVRLAISTVSIDLPAPDASRLVPSLVRPAADLAMCWVAPRRAKVSELEVGPVRLLFVPGEPTTSAEKALREATHGARSVALANGYLGYLEAPDLVRSRQGESKRHYFGPELLTSLVDAVRLTQRHLESAQAGNDAGLRPRVLER